MKKWMMVLVVLLVFFQALTLAQLGNLQQELQNSRQQLSNLMMTQNGQISSMASRIEALQKSQASVIDHYDYSVGQLNPETLNVPITFSVTPKELTTGTQATLQAGDASVPMTRSGASFKATVSANVFKPLQATVILADGNAQRTERLDVRDSLRDQLLPYVDVNFDGENSGYTRKPAELSVEYRKAGRLWIKVKPAVGNTLATARLVFEIDGKVVSDKAVNPGGTPTELNERFTLSAGQKLTMTVIATDQLGLTYRSVIDQFALDAQANPAQIDGWFSPESTIADKNGNVVWTPRT